MDNPAFTPENDENEIKVTSFSTNQPKSKKKKVVFADSNQNTNMSWGLLPPKGKFAKLVTILLSTAAVFLVARSVLGDLAAPGGTIFALEILVLLALICGQVMVVIAKILTKITRCEIRLPPLLGMLILGILLKNIPYNMGQFGRVSCANGTVIDSINDLDDIDEHSSWKRSLPDEEFRMLMSEYLPPSSNEADMVLSRPRRMSEVLHSIHGMDNFTLVLNFTAKEIMSQCDPRYIGHELDPFISRSLRTVCLAVILIMAGLELDPVALWHLSGLVIRATIIPCLVEASVAAILSHLILGFRWTVGFMLGFVLAAVSPAVILPVIISLTERGYGVTKGIPTIVIAACSADDVLAISGFGIFLGLTFNKGTTLLTLVFHGPIELALGISFGVAWGVLAQYIPEKRNDNLVFFRVLLLISGGLIALFGAHLIHYDGAGGVATITMALIAGIKWRQEGWGVHNPVSQIFNNVWIIMEPVLFALIGTEIQLDKLDTQTIGYGVLIIIVGLILRMGATYVSVCGGDLTFREKVFMAFAWIPKATGQAALGSIFLDTVKKEGIVDQYYVGEQILTLAGIATINKKYLS